MKERPLAELREETARYMGLLKYSPSRIAQAGTAWNHLEARMRERGASKFNVDVAEDFFESVLEGRAYESASRWERDQITLVSLLVEMLETGRIKYKRDRKFVALSGPIAAESSELLADLRRRGLSDDTVGNYKSAFNRFSQFMDAQGMEGLASLTPAAVIEFMEGTAFAGSWSRAATATAIRFLLRKAYENGRTADDLSRHVPRVKKVRQPELPSVYTADEIARILAAVDRASAKGKRDFAMMLLAAKLGLRASDICGLTFESLDWRSSALRTVQHKTGEVIELPLLPEVGAAIIDYVRYARPDSALPYVFLHVVRPFDRICSSTLASIVAQYIGKAGVNAGRERRHGPHALRHSLAARLLESKTPLPVISSVLGHASSESTRYYLRIDETALRQCALEVPEVER